MCRGETFRPALLRLGELRSILPLNTHILALTATANQNVQKKIKRIIGMPDMKVIFVSPSKENLTYSVAEYVSISSNFTAILNELIIARECYPRTIIFCRKYQHCSDIYTFFKRGLGKEFTHPIDAPSDAPQFRLVDMFVSCTDEATKTSIINSFTIHKSPLRIVISTIAFGMGIDCCNVTQVIHLGPPDDIESYVQETGRAGRNGETASCTLLVTKQWRRFVDDENMIEYVENNSICRRDILFPDEQSSRPKSKCLCCDICQATCTCDKCASKF